MMQAQVLEIPESKIMMNKDYSMHQLNDLFDDYHFEERISKLYQYFDESEVLVTSSFGINSAFLLHFFNKIRPTQKVHFIDTTYHFPETLAYKETLKSHFDLKVIEVFPHEGQNKMTTEEKWWIDHPKMCCTINKIAPLDEVLSKYKVWVSGLISYQTTFRNGLRIFEENGDIIKFHPLIDMDEGNYLFYKGLNKLPAHPLQAKGYGSVGCANCTKAGEDRSGRWAGSKKSECGIHQNFYFKK